MTVEVVIGGLKAHEESLGGIGDAGEEHLLLARAERESRFKRNGGGNGSVKKNCKFNKAKVCCYNCDDQGISPRNVASQRKKAMQRHILLKHVPKMNQPYPDWKEILPGKLHPRQRGR